jgi:hypothetical protein
LGVGLTNLPCKKKIVEKPPRNSAGFCGGGQGLSWAVEPRKHTYNFSWCFVSVRNFNQHLKKTNIKGTEWIFGPKKDSKTWTENIP